jgi:RNA polymerase primary sigma factor
MVNSGRRKRSSEILSVLLEKADVQGFLTTEDLMEVYPDLRGDVDYLDSIVLALRRRGVDILDGENPTMYEEDEDEDLTPSDFDPSFADLTPISSDDTIGL